MRQVIGKFKLDRSATAAIRQIKARGLTISQMRRPKCSAVRHIWTEPREEIGTRQLAYNVCRELPSNARVIAIHTTSPTASANGRSSLALRSIANWRHGITLHSVTPTFAPEARARTTSEAPDAQSPTA